MVVVLLRIDDRLIHGQIGVKWISFLKAQRVVVVNDEVAKDPILSMAVPLGAPAGVKVDVLTVKDAIEKLTSPEWEKERIAVIAKTTEDAYNLIKGGVKIDWINVGQQGHSEGEVRVTRTFSINEHEAKLFKGLHDSGIKLIYKQLPEHNNVDFFAEIKKHFNI
ncbi:MAG: PTS system mannose/fructose/N-acetylgalactosamine-transporter subunit IIB [Candidatus Asgardarchaeia archaeon]